MARTPTSPPRRAQRAGVLAARQRLKMARSAHAYVRGSTAQFYEWLETSAGKSLPTGPAVWICGDCHVGNLGPVAHSDGRVAIQIRDLDQTVIGNPAHDLIRLALSLATAARGSDLPGVTTARMIEQMMVGYESALDAEGGEEKAEERDKERPSVVRLVMKEAARRSWKHLLEERIDHVKPTIPMGSRFWPLAKVERRAIDALFETEPVRKLVAALRVRDDDTKVKVRDAAYWMKGCSSLGLLRYAVLVGAGKGDLQRGSLCLMDVKEATAACAPRYTDARMPRANGDRVVTGAKSLAPYLGHRMLSARLLDRSVFIRELLPQDLKIEIDGLRQEEAMVAARFLAGVVGRAHARQLDGAAREAWKAELGRHRSKTLDAPSWLWTSVVDLVASHEAAYLHHCRRYAMETMGVDR